MSAPRKTPIGVLILGILTIVFGVITLGSGALLLLGAGVMGASGNPIGGAFAILLLIIGGILALFGILGILAGVGLIKLRRWAWWLTMIVGVLSFLGSITSPMWFVGVVWLIIVIYLVVVKKHFGPQPAGM